MTIIEVSKLPNGAHSNQTIFGASPETFPLPEGWAVLPAEIETPNFPFGDITVDDTETYPVVTSWTPLPIPEPEEEPKPQPTHLDVLEAQVTYAAMMTDTLLEV